jgi:dipeptidyl aminopeptidase/acylaminoacyl peptidase
MALAISFLAIFPLLALALENPRGMTIDDIFSMKVVSDPRISPDGRLVAFVVTKADLKANFFGSDIWIIGADRSALRPLTRSPRRNDHPRWSPDSRRLAFISDRDGKAQIYITSLDGGEPIRITDSKTSIESFEWSPDGTCIAYIAAEPLSEDREKEKKEGFDQILVDQDYQYARVNIVHLAWGSAVGEMPKPERITEARLHVTELAWAPDGRSIAFAARSTPKLADSMTTQVYVTAVDGASNSRSPVKLTDSQRSKSGIAWSPQGNTLSYLAGSDKYWIGPSRIHLVAITNVAGAVVSEKSAPAKVLQPSFDGYIRNSHWSADGRSIIFAADFHDSRHIYRISRDGADPRPLSNQPGVQGPFSLSADSELIAYVKDDPAHPADVWLGHLSSGKEPALADSVQLTFMNPDLGGLSLGRAETIHWKSSKDGRDIEGILVYPVDYQPGKRYPLITSVHGGPEGAHELAFTASWGDFPQVYSARGYATFLPNFRGSSNYGAEFASANVGDLGGGDYLDVMSGVDHLIQIGIADPARLGVKGWSYGGYMSGWIIGHTDRFKAAAFGAGLSNAISYYSQADIQFSRETLHQGNPWKNPENMIERSPVKYLQNAKTPTLIFHGEKDERVPLPQSLENYMGLKKAGVTTQLVIYPREPHGLREPKHQLDKIRRELDWFEKYLRAE